MALEYKQLADWQEHQWPETDEEGRQLRAAADLKPDDP